MSNFDNDWKSRLDYLTPLDKRRCNGEGDPCVSICYCGG